MLVAGRPALAADHCGTQKMKALYQVVRRSAPLQLAVVSAAAFGFIVNCSKPARGQSAETTASPVAAATLFTPPAPNDRDNQYSALARDVNALDRELSLIKRVVKLVTPAVVHIEARPRPKAEELRQVEEAGSGVIVDIGARQYVLTNRHVIGRSTPERILIHLADGRVFRPLRTWSDDLTDVAIMSFDVPDLPSARLGDSEALEIGDQVLAIGSPFGLSQSVTRGIVSAKGRHNLNLGNDEKLLQDFLQTDAAINPGNSGGPLVNLRGEVVGLNTAIASASGGNEGIGFSIPINIAARVANALVQGQRIPRGHLGVTLDSSYTDAQAKSLGLSRLMGTRISSVTPKSPAEIAELQVGDVILEFNGVRVEQESHLINLVQLTEVGRKVEILVLRGGKPVKLFAKIADNQSDDAPPQNVPTTPATRSRPTR
jgi:serine protease Do